MRKIFVFFVVLSSLFSFSQTVTLNWFGAKEMAYGNSKVKIPYFTGNGFHFDADKKTITCTVKLEGEGSYNRTVQFTNVEYEPISTPELGDLDSKNITNEITQVVRQATSRGVQETFLTITPIINGEGGYKKIKSFSYSLSSVTNKNNTTQKNAGTNQTALISHSVLSTGNWFRFYIEKSGVYKVSKSFIESLGISLSGVNPNRIKIYGNGGRMLPLSNSIPYPLDLAENSIQVIGGEDGIFNSEDYILFYGEGVTNWNEESQTNINLYDTKSYYYMTISDGDGNRIRPMTQPTGNTTLSLTTYDSYQFHEVDLVNITQLGRQWFGGSFEIKQEQTFDFNFPNIDTATPVQVDILTAAAAFTPTSFKVNANGTTIGTINFPALNANSSTKFFLGNLPFGTTINGSENIKITLTYDNGGVPGSDGYLDYIRLNAKSKLKGFGKQFNFQYNLAKTLQGIVAYEFSDAGGISQIWDITDPTNISSIENKGVGQFSFKANLGDTKKYLALDLADVYTPLKEARPRIKNQDIKGTVFNNENGVFKDIDYVIITPERLQVQADKLANFHRNNSGLNVRIVTLESIYQEFSSGKQDIAAIRNCIKYIYENASSADKKVKYVNLFGDASFDYKDRIQNNTNIVPIYHALNSNTIGESSFASDDFYGLMDANEGNVVSFFGGIDIAVGRMLAKDATQAEELVNKVLEYHDVKSYGNWRNNIALFCDDSDPPPFLSVTSPDVTLQLRQNALADKITLEKPFLNVNKIILDSYVQEAAAGGARYPKARDDIFNAFEKGALIFNYLGHGGEDGLSSERIWQKIDGQNLSNQYKYPLFITITCDFSRFDNPTRPTAGELTFMNPKGGAIAMITTIREIGQFSAENFNDLFTQNLLSYGSSQYTSIAEALRVSKNTNPNSATNVVFYLGDPALKLAIPNPKIRLTKVNDQPVSGTTDDFKSLALMKLSGEVTDENNVLISDYNGEVSSVILDKNVPRVTLNNDGFSPPMDFITLGQTIFRGNATVKNGLFEFSFIVPRDIRVPLGNGKISFYAKKDKVLQNETGFDTTIKVGGINKNAAEDNISPKIKLFMNDESFISGGITNASPFLLVFLSDESGINTASGIGHDIVATLDGNVNNQFVLNDYYQTKLDDYKNGTLRFPLRNLSVGLHTLSVKAWDVYNNPTSAEIQFLVVDNNEVVLEHVLNYPNPFVDYTEFWFTHNKPFELLTVQIQVFTITGKVVWTKNQTISTDGFLSRDLSWDGRDDFGNKIGKGVYIYKLTVKSNATNKKAEKIEKLVIL